MGRRALIFLSVATLVAAPARARAQAASGFHPRWEIPGLDFSPNGVWRRRARQVREGRAALLSQGAFRALNAPMVLGAPLAATQAVSGVLKVPAVRFQYKDISAKHTAAEYDAVLFGTTPPLGRPYTYRTFYQQMSNGLLDIQGQTYGPATLDSNEVTYAGTPPCSGNPYGSTNCNGLFYSGQVPAPLQRMQNGLREALSKVDDGAINWAQYDSDGDGYVDLVVFIQPAIDGACGGSTNNHLWAHRSALFTSYQTKTPDPNRAGQFIQVSDYILQSGLGGDPSCDATQIMPIGTVAHETGHGFGLPDLYDLTYNTAGVGNWSLMGTGAYTSPESPSRMDAWSLSQLGWVTIRPLTASGTYTFGAAPTSDTAFYARVRGTNTRGEYFLLENREAVQADTALFAWACGANAGCGGLLIWHIDSLKACPDYRVCGNGVNASVPHGVAVEEADGLYQLEYSGGDERGDAGDVYPGTSGNTAFSFITKPAAVKNLDGGFVGFVVDSIRKRSLDGPMSFRIRFGAPTVVKASDTVAVVQVDAGTYHVFRDLLDSGAVHTIAVADTQYTNANRTRDAFVSWSNGKSRVQTDTAGVSADTLIATVAQAQQFAFTAGANGSVTANPAQDTSGSYLSEPVTLTAVPAGGYLFTGWTGDTSASAAMLTLPMTHPYAVTANFGTALVIMSPDTLPGAIMGATYLDTLHATGGTGSYTWQVIGQPPPSLSLTTSGVLTGTPSQAGTFSLQARVTSASLQVTDTFTLITTAPTLSTATVVAQILNGSGTLTAGELTYLDLLGNQNNAFDVGDFLAWVNATGAPPVSAPPKRTTPQGKSQ